jgi:hypothetical protein
MEAKIVKSGTWLYDEAILSEVWIVKQNFEYHYEEGFDDGPEELSPNGETFQILFARDGQMIAPGPARLSLCEAVSAAEELIPTSITWTNDRLQKLYNGRWYSRTTLV